MQVRHENFSGHRAHRDFASYCSKSPETKLLYIVEFQFFGFALPFYTSD